MSSMHTRSLAMSAIGLAIAGLSGCALSPPPETTQPIAFESRPDIYRIYTPATRPVNPVTEQLPESPRDAQPLLSIVYTVTILNIELPRDSVSTDEAFWKRVNEQVLDLPTYDLFFKNGIRVGQLPVSELQTVRRLIEDRQYKQSEAASTPGQQIEIPVRQGIVNQNIFYLDRTNSLVGRSWENCDNLFYFSFEATPRNQDMVRIAITPTVRARERKLQYALAPGRGDREVQQVVDESHYDATIHVDLPLQNMLIVAPSVEARWPTSLGAAFWLDSTPSEQRERLLIFVPHALVRNIASTQTPPVSAR